MKKLVGRICLHPNHNAPCPCMDEKIKELLEAASRVERYLATQYRMKSLSEGTMEMWRKLQEALAHAEGKAS